MPLVNERAGMRGQMSWLLGQGDVVERACAERVTLGKMLNISELPSPLLYNQRGKYLLHS